MKSFEQGDLVRLKFHPGLYGYVVKNKQIDLNNGNPLLMIAWTSEFNEQLNLVETIFPRIQNCSKESLVNLCSTKEIGGLTN
ncbi:MAG: hypothetical protein Q8P81_03680 [Nanoarchaeota archaeon]|nr:hypothetical protein [Nanoarchaeota archaeon]